MEHRDVSDQRNMAEAAVESPVARFYCHKCLLQISPVLPDYTCPQCQGGFIEEVAQTSSSEPSEESDEDIYGSGLDGNEDVDTFNQVTELWNMLSYIRPNEATSTFLGSSVPNVPTEGREGRYSRPGPSRRTRYTRVPGRRSGQEADNARSRTEGFLQHLVATLQENTTGMVTNATFPVFLNLHSNPGDYAWGRGGWNAIITQLINQLDGTGPPPLPKEKINEIPTVNICQEQVDKNLQCTVCMEDFEKDEPVRRLACDHHFHNGCITPWLELHGTCPICRKLLNDSSASQENMYSNAANMMDGTSHDSEMSESDSMSMRNPHYDPERIYEFQEDCD